MTTPIFAIIYLQPTTPSPQIPDQPLIIYWKWCAHISNIAPLTNSYLHTHVSEMAMQSSYLHWCNYNFACAFHQERGREGKVTVMKILASMTQDY